MILSRGGGGVTPKQGVGRGLSLLREASSFGTCVVDILCNLIVNSFSQEKGG